VGASLKDDGSREPSDFAIEVAIGAHVEVELIAESGENEHLAFDIVPDAGADFSAGFLGVGTPLARAILGRRAGSVVPYQVGDITQVKILVVGISSRAPTDDVTADRRAVIQRAIAKSDLADAVRFALTVDQKWGDTDPEGIASNWEATSGEEEPEK
jgi:hypothetical protein